MTRASAWVAALAVSVFSCSREPPGRLSQTSVDFGELREGERGVRKIRLDNQGPEPLAVLGYTEDCACLRVDFSRGEIPPGESAEITISFMLNRGSGRVDKTVEIRTNDRVEPVKKITITAVVRPNFIFEPDMLRFGEVPAGARVVREVLMRSVDGKPFAIRQARCSVPLIEISSVARGDTARLTVTLQAPRVLSPLAASIEILTDDPPRWQSYVVEATIVGRLVATPSPINFGMATPEAFDPVIVKLTNRFEEPVRIERVEVGNRRCLDAQLRVVTEGREYELVVRVRPDAPAGRFASYVRVETSHESLTITVTGYVRR